MTLSIGDVVGFQNCCYRAWETPGTLLATNLPKHAGIRIHVSSMGRGDPATGRKGTAPKGPDSRECLLVPSFTMEGQIGIPAANFGGQGSRLPHCDSVIRELIRPISTMSNFDPSDEPSVVFSRIAAGWCEISTTYNRRGLRAFIYSSTVFGVDWVDDITTFTGPRKQPCALTYASSPSTPRHDWSLRLPPSPQTSTTYLVRSTVQAYVPRTRNSE